MNTFTTTGIIRFFIVFTFLFAQPAFATPESEEGGDINYFCTEPMSPIECDFPSAPLTHPFLLNTWTQKIATILGGRGNSAVRGGRGGSRTSSIDVVEGTTGLNAGGGPIRYGVWASYSYSDYENDFSSTAFDGHTHSGLVGVDFSPWERTVFGIAFGYEDSDSDTSFNNGSEQTNGYTVAPYFAALLTDIWSVDVSIGYSSLDIDQDRIVPFAVVGGARATSSTDADRWFGSINLNGVTFWNNWILSGRLGALWARNSIDGFTETGPGGTFPDQDSKLGQWSIAGEAAYGLGDWEPYARVTYEYDFSMSEVSTFPQPSNDRDNFLLGAGIRYFSMNGWSGNLEYYKRLGREDFDEDTVSLTLRYEF